MTDRQTNRLAMYQAVQVICNENATVWNGVPIIQTVFTDFTDKLSKLETTAQEQIITSVGITEDKEDLRNVMSEMAVALAQPIQAYAAMMANNELLSVVDYSMSSFERAKDIEVILMSKNILEAGTVNLADLTPYGVSQLQLDDLDVAITAFEGKQSEPRVFISSRKEVTARLNDLFTAIDSILKNQLDKLMYIFKEDEFYRAYKAARIIIDR